MWKMGIPWISLLLLTTGLQHVLTDHNYEICDVIKESYGLVPPPIPTNFEARREDVDYVQKAAIYEEIYFDYSNSREKYMMLQKGIEHHFLFDYQVQQVVRYDILHPGANIKVDPLSHTCKAVDMDDSEFRDIFGFDTYGARVQMLTSNQALGFGGQYAFAYNGTHTISNRGLLVDKFIGCVYEAYMDTSVNSTFFFSSNENSAFVTAGNTHEKVVTGISNGLLSVPVKADLFGSINDDETGSTEFFNRTNNYFYFKGEPEFKLETFKIPPYLYCDDYRGRKSMKKLPTAFDTRIQKTKLKRDILGKLVTSEVTSFENVLYDQEKNLARRDFTPGTADTDIKSKFENSLPVKTIYDFNQGLLYVTNIASGRCYIRPIIHGDFFEMGNDNSLFISMATPEHIFQMETDNMEYKGQDFTRNIECDVWVGKDEKKLNATYIKETYVSTNGWHETADELAEYGVPIKHTVIQKELNGELLEGVESYSFLKFKAKAPILAKFDVSNCIEPENHKDFAILLTISDDTKQLLFDYKMQFLETVQYYINDVAQLLSPLRVQRLQYRIVSKSNPLPLILVTLVDKIKLRTKIPVGQRGASLDEAVVNLHKFIERNQFAIKFYAPNSKEMTLVPALKGSLYVKTSSGDLTYFAPVQDVSNPSAKKIVKIEENLSKIMFDNPSDHDENKEAKGMTSGGLALLAFAMMFIGIGIGVCVMYLYLRHRNESKLEEKIHLSFQSSGEGSIETTIAENAQ